MSWFAEVRYTPNSRFSFMTSADITNYTAKSFDESRLVPLVGAEVSYYFMKNQRAALTLSGVDLLPLLKSPNLCMRGFPPPRTVAIFAMDIPYDVVSSTGDVSVTLERKAKLLF